MKNTNDKLKIYLLNKGTNLELTTYPSLNQNKTLNIN